MVLGDNIALAKSESSTSDSKELEGRPTRNEMTKMEEREVEETIYYKIDASGNIVIVTAKTEGAKTKREKVKKEIPVKYWCTDCPYEANKSCTSTQWKEVEA